MQNLFNYHFLVFKVTASGGESHGDSGGESGGETGGHYEKAGGTQGKGGAQGKGQESSLITQQNILGEPEDSPEVVKEKETALVEFNKIMAPAVKIIHEEKKESVNLNFLLSLKRIERRIDIHQSELLIQLADAKGKQEIIKITKDFDANLKKIAIERNLRLLLTQKEDLNKTLIENNKHKDRYEQLGGEYMFYFLTRSGNLKKDFDELETLFAKTQFKDAIKKDPFFHLKPHNFATVDLSYETLQALKKENEVLYALAKEKEKENNERIKMDKISGITFKKTDNDLDITVAGTDNKGKAVEAIQVKIDLKRYLPQVKHKMQYDTVNFVDLKGFEQDDLALSKVFSPKICNLLLTKHFEVMPKIIDTINECKPVVVVKGIASFDGDFVANDQLAKDREALVVSMLQKKYPQMKIEKSKEPMVIGPDGEKVEQNTLEITWKKVLELWNAEFANNKCERKQFQEMLDKYNHQDALSEIKGAKEFFDRHFGKARGVEITLKPMENILSKVDMTSPMSVPSRKSVTPPEKDIKDPPQGKLA